MDRKVGFRTLVERFATLHIYPRGFTPVTEEQFVADMESFRPRQLWLENLFTVCLYLTYTVAVQLVEPDQSGIALALRFGIAIPLLLLVNVSMWFRVKPHIREAAILLASCAAASIEVFLHRTHANDGDFPVHFVVIVFLVFTNNVMRLRLPYALIAVGWALGTESLFLETRHGGQPHAQPIHAAMVSAVGVLTLIANYSQNREARRAFLRYAQKEDLIGSLALSNKHLAEAALTDALTGLANRACLEKHLAILWAQSPAAAGDCSIVMVDIDHFKDLNDRYGHLYGDRVIKRVAHLLAEALRGVDDFIARYGGEEFLVVLPRTPVHLAIIVAERLRGLVELAGLPSLRADDPDLEGMRATVSCGVAGGAPRLYPDPYQLIGEADQALYLAKRSGRNRVRTWENHVVETASAGDKDETATPKTLAPLTFKAG